MLFNKYMYNNMINNLNYILTEKEIIQAVDYIYKELLPTD